MSRQSIMGLFLALLIVSTVRIQEAAAEDVRSRLERLRNEIDSLSTLLDKQKASEKNFLVLINTLDQQIATRQQLIGELKTLHSRELKAVNQYEVQIQKTSVLLEASRAKLEAVSGEVRALEDLIRERAIFVYKKGGRESIKFLLAAQNPGDLYQRQKYIRLIQTRDHHNLAKLREARGRQAMEKSAFDTHLAELQQVRENKVTAANRSASLLKEQDREKAELENNRKSIQAMLAEIRGNTEALRFLITEGERAANQIEDWIATLEKKRTSGEVQEIRLTSALPEQVVVKQVKQFPTFSHAKGSLPWPVTGKIIRRFGFEKNAQTGTVTENPGIDIEVGEGTDVIAVQKGICTRITYLRGFGTTMLIEHGDGYYTVYSHLGDVWVREGEAVEAGRVIGKVGTATTSGTALLHFQVWHKREKEDPLKWLG